jgi:hypothetical protein
MLISHANISSKPLNWLQWKHNTDLCLWCKWFDVICFNILRLFVKNKLFKSSPFLNHQKKRDFIYHISEHKIYFFKFSLINLYLLFNLSCKNASFFNFITISYRKEMLIDHFLSISILIVVVSG